MTDTVTLHALTPADRPLVDRLWQLYRHDLSEFRGDLPDAEGRYRDGRLDLYLGPGSEVAAGTAHLIRWARAGSAPAPAGLVMARRAPAGGHVLGEFFVVRAARRHGVGGAAARRVLACRPGRWEIAFQEENPVAARFWRRLAADVVGAGWRQEARAVPGRPDLPPDVWLTLEVPGPQAPAFP